MRNISPRRGRHGSSGSSGLTLTHGSCIDWFDSEQAMLRFNWGRHLLSCSMFLVLPKIEFLVQPRRPLTRVGVALWAPVPERRYIAGLLILCLHSHVGAELEPRVLA